MTDTALTHRQVDVGDSSLHVVTAGDEDAPPILFVHGWPATSACWHRVLELAAGSHHAMAVDLPGVGRSTGGTTDGTKQQLAAVLHELVAELGLGEVAVVGHDIGGMIAYSYLRAYPAELTRAVIMDVSVPGVEPWSAVLANPYVWHFAFQAVPELPETLVRGRQREYFDYFYDVLTPDGNAIPDAAREEYVAGYTSDTSLSAGFDWYRAFSTDARTNAEFTDTVDVPLLYVRGTGEYGNMDDYVNGFTAAGVTNVSTALVEGGHFLPDESPDALWAALRGFLQG